MNCNHTFKVSSYTTKHITYRCSKCNERAERSSSKEEEKYISEKQNRRLNPPKHYVWHNFAKAFQNDDMSWKKEKLNKMHAISKWAEKYPEHIRIIRCDDSVNSSSVIIFIEHKSERSYMGTTMLCVPQCSPDPPISMFLYPNHVENMIAALQEIEVQTRTIKEIENADSIKDSKEVNEMLLYEKS